MVFITQFCIAQRFLRTCMSHYNGTHCILFIIIPCLYQECSFSHFPRLSCLSTSCSNAFLGTFPLFSHLEISFPFPLALASLLHLILPCGLPVSEHVGFPTLRTATHLICICHCLFQKLYLALKGIYLTSFGCDLLLHPHCHFHSWKKKKKRQTMP